MVKNLGNHTLFILTRNRPQWIEYSLNFYANFRYTGTILIADDSEDAEFEKSSQIVKKFKSQLKIKHIQGEGRGLSTRKKRYCMTRYYAVQEIDTDYYSQTGDDDIFFTPELFKAIDFLDKNSEYNYVQGSMVQVYLDDKMNIIKTGDTWSPTCDYDDPLDRISHYAYQPGCPLLGVNRTKPLKDLIKVEEEIGWPPFARKNTDGLEYFDEELSWSLQIYASGKIGRIKECFLYFRLKTTPTKKEDRIENLYLHDDLTNNYVIGPIANIYQNSLPNCVNETHKEISSFLKLYGTKYSKEDCDFQISQCLWRLISRYNGAGLLKIKTKFSKDNQLVTKRNFIIKINFFIKRTFLVLKNFKFYFKLKKGYDSFKKQHDKLKKTIFGVN